jgi:hypothetical protein
MGDSTQLRLRSDGLSWREIDEEFIVLDTEVSTYLTLNASGGVLWKRLESGATVDELIDALTVAFDVERDVAAADVKSFVDICRAKNLLAD